MLRGEKRHELDKLYRGSGLERRIYDYATGDLLHKTSDPKEIAWNLITVTSDGSSTSGIGKSYDLRVEPVIRPDPEIVQQEKDRYEHGWTEMRNFFSKLAVRVNRQGVKSLWHGLGAVQRGNATMCRSY